MEQIGPFEVKITEGHIFRGGTSSLTSTGSSIQFIRDSLVHLEEGWNGKKGILQEGISRAREDQIITDITERFSEVIEDLEIPSDMSLIPVVVKQFDELSTRRVYSANKLPSSALVKSVA